MRQQNEQGNGKRPAYRYVWALWLWDKLGRVRVQGIYREQWQVGAALARCTIHRMKDRRPLVLVRKLRESNVKRLYGPRARVQ